MSYDQILATFQTDDALPDHARVQINGKTYQISEIPGWRSRPHNQAPIWVSDEAARVLEWAMSIEADDATAEEPFSRRGRKRGRGEFNTAEAMDHFCGPHPHGDKGVREWWDAVKTELRQSNLLSEVGYFNYAPSRVAWEFFPRAEAPQVRRMF